jgi:EmrB/QacA subfamily drug resistance transporter
MPTTTSHEDVAAGPKPLVVQSGRVTDRTVLLVASLGAFLAFLDATIVNVAFPSIRESFPETSISELSWVLNSYNIVFAAFLVPAGRMADLIGRRRAFAWGVAVFTVFSVICAVAPTVEWLIAARAFQALGAALLVPASLGLVVQAFDPEHRTHAVGLWGASAAVAAGLGPPVGGLLIEIGDWRWAFLINLPVGLLALLAARRQLVESRAPGRRTVPDLRGASLFALALALLTTAIVQGNDWGWASAGVLACVLGSALALAAFVWSSRHHRSPLLDVALLRIRPFTVANASTALAGMGFYAYLLVNILWLQYVWGYNVLQAGLALVPGALVAAVVAAVLGPRAAASGYRRFIIPGALVWVGAYAWYYSQSGLEPDFLQVWLPGQVLSGIGAGAVLPLLGSAALASVPGGRYATASAVVSSSRQIGGVLGIALLVVIIGTPAPATAADDLRPGWLFAAGCFALCAVAAAALGRIPESRAEPADEGDAARAVILLPRKGEARDDGETEALPLLGRLPAPARAALEGSARQVSLPAGAWLMRAGDAADSLYLVRSGRLEVVVDDQVVRELGPGSAIGELALLTGGTRSASIRARRDSTLAEISRSVFDTVVRADPEALSVLAHVLAEQLQSPPPPPIAKGARPSVVAVLALHEGAPAAAVAEALVGELRRDLSVATPARLDAEGVLRAERDHDRVVLVAEHSDGEGWRFALRQADHLVLVSADIEPAAAAEVDRHGADLVIIGPRPARDRVRGWSDRLQPWRITYALDEGLNDSMRPVAARIAGTSVGLVMAGGGARAFAHIGVLQVLAEAGVRVDRVAGCSLGSIVAGLHAAGHTPEEMQEVCYQEFVRRSPFSDYTLPTVSLAKGRRTGRALEQQFGEVLIEELPHQFSCVSTDLLARRQHVHRSGRLSDAIQASLALPVLFPPRRFGDQLLVDGGILDNLPVGLLTERDEGPVLAVNIAMGGGGGGPRRAGPPRTPPLGDTMLRTMMIGSGGAVEAAHAQGAAVVTPPPMGVGLLEFHQLDLIVESGRMAARQLLEQTGGSFPGTAWG